MIDPASYHREGYVVARSDGIPPMKKTIENAITRRELVKEQSVYYRIAQSTPELVALAGNPSILFWIYQLGVTMPVMGTMPILRIDRPHDNIHRTPAHQDYWFSLLSDNAVTVWFPLYELDADMGPLEIIPRSHKSELVAFTKNIDGNRNPFRMRNELPDYMFEPITIKRDEILIFSQFLLHRSGVNTSVKNRYSVQLRYNDLLTMKPIELSYKLDHSDYVTQKQAELCHGHQ